MSFQERAALVQDDEEWLNIPPILRRLLRGLNEDNERNRALTEALRQEQRDTNLLLRRLIQKQTDMELDFSRSNLLLATKPHVIRAPVEAATNPDQAVDLQARKKLDKTSDRVRAVEAKLEELRRDKTDADTKAATRVKEVEDTLQTVLQELEKRVRDACGALDSRMQKGEETLAEITRDLSSRKELHEQQTALVNQMLDHMKAVSDNQKTTEASLCTLGEDIVARDEEVEKRLLLFDRRFAALQKTLEGIQGYLKEEKKLSAAMHQQTAERCRQEFTCALEKRHNETQRLFLDVRQQSTELQRSCDHHSRDIDEQLHILSLKQLEMSHKMEQEVLPNFTDMTRKHERLLGKLTSVEDECADIRETVSKRDRDDARLTEWMAAEKRSQLESLSVVREQLVQIGAQIADMRSVNATNYEKVRVDVEALRGVVVDSGTQRCHTENQVTRLCEVIRDISSAVETAEKRVQRLAETLDSHTRACEQTVAPVLPVTELVQPDQPLRKAVEEATRLFQEECAACREAQRSFTTQQDATSARVSQMERKLSDFALSLDYLKQQPAPVATLPAWAAESLKELSPTLVELEAVKRRLVSIEAQREEVIGSMGRSSEDQRREELQLQMSDTLEDTRRRLLELSRRVLAQEQLVATLARHRAGRAMVGDAHDRGDDDNDSEDERALQTATASVVRRLATDMTKLLEKLYVTEQSLTEARAATSKELAEMGRRLDTATAEVASREDALRAAVLGHESACSAKLAELEARLPAEGKEERVETLKPLSQAEVMAMMDCMLDDRASRQEQALAETARAVFAESVQPLQAELKNQAEALEHLSSVVQDLQHRPLPSEVAREEEEEQQRQRQQHKEREERRASELASVHSQLEHHAELLQAQAVTLRGVVEESLPHLREELYRRIADLAPRDGAADDPCSKVEEQLAGVVAQLAAVETQLSHLEGECRESDQRSRETAADLRCELLDAIARRVQQEREPSARQDAPTSPEGRGNTGDLAATVLALLQSPLQHLEQELKQYAYPRAQLEERLENTWMSVISLVARKMDIEEATRQLDGLRRLLHEEAEMSMKLLKEDVEASLADKISLQELQDILENHIPSADLDTGEDVPKGDDDDDDEDNF